MNGILGAAGWKMPAAALLLCLIVGLLLVSRRRSVTLRVPARLESIRPLASLVERMGREAALSEQAVFHCRLALDEACMNIIEHSYDDILDGQIEATIEVRKGSCAIFLTDFGKPYDPTRVSLPERDISLENASPGGLGLYLMKNVMDEVRYEPSPGGNRLTMIKHSQPDSPSTIPFA